MPAPRRFKLLSDVASLVLNEWGEAVRATLDELRANLGQSKPIDGHVRLEDFITLGGIWALNCSLAHR
jgi:hypothetical protein